MAGKRQKKKTARVLKKGRRAMTPEKQKLAEQTAETAAEQTEPTPAAPAAEVAAPAVKTAKTAKALKTAAKAGKQENAETVTVEKKRPGRKPMTEEQKAEAKRLREEKKAAGKTTVYLQYRDTEAEIAALVEAAKADYKSTHKRARITTLRLYLKPEEYTCYYVINESGFGKIAL